MHKLVSFNHRIISAENSFLSAASSAALYGKGVFTTVAIYNAKPFLWEKHWRRLTENAGKVGIDLSVFSEYAIEKLLAEIIAENNFTNGRARLTFFDESASRIWQAKPQNKTSFLIQTADFRLITEDFRLTFSPFAVNSKSPLAGVKSCNYLENILAVEDAKTRGFDEAIRLNERGEIVSVSMANIFWIKNGEIFTPALETGCLAGTTRAVVLENFAVAETKAGINEIIEADEVFLTSAGIGIGKVKSIDGRKLLDSSKTSDEVKRFLKKLSDIR